MVESLINLGVAVVCAAILYTMLMLMRKARKVNDKCVRFDACTEVFDSLSHHFDEEIRPNIEAGNIPHQYGLGFIKAMELVVEREKELTKEN